MKIAVTGAAGFIGHQIITRLAQLDIEIVAVVRSQAADIPDYPKLKKVCMDILSAPTNAYDLLGRPDMLIHLAWGGLPNYRSLHHFEQELPAHYEFLKNQVQSGLPALLVMGTCFEYGMQSGPLDENKETYPNNPYGFAKDMLRRQLEYLKSAHPFVFIWARLFYLYGNRQSETSLFSQLKKAVERGDKMFNMSGGEQLRDYLHVDTVAQYIVDLCLKGKDIGIVNVCSGRPISIRKLVESWLRDNGWTIPLNLGHYPYPDYEPMAFWGDAHKLVSIIGNTV